MDQYHRKDPGLTAGKYERSYFHEGINKNLTS